MCRAAAASCPQALMHGRAGRMPSSRPLRRSVALPEDALLVVVKLHVGALRDARADVVVHAGLHAVQGVPEGAREAHDDRGPLDVHELQGSRQSDVLVLLAGAKDGAQLGLRLLHHALHVVPGEHEGLPAVEVALVHAHGARCQGRAEGCARERRRGPQAVRADE
eukprot:CAMPEP_0206015710 /NCGR_PEP_ID=MMETSP1464-20131121/20919_1 /ASSEMBLY_ACC=CAM_ASM_001124 /TAXON_ID=119497 /ORGANISM="Exanthemachrysis gayraliae, Strain RCC1523" /LENGTH=164 /DNA_ID=CAMNT_0053389507 /DNA_START=269 /DNA_END=760 /DNA_ORIENTATION=-